MFALKEPLKWKSQVHPLPFNKRFLFSKNINYITHSIGIISWAISWGKTAFDLFAISSLIKRFILQKKVE